jgi:hypothetical protein
MLKNYNLNKDEIEDQQFVTISKCAHLPRGIVAFAPEQHVEKPLGN